MTQPQNDTTLKKVINKLSSLYISLLPIMLVSTGICNSVMVFLSSDCKINANIVDYTNSTIFSTAVKDSTINGFTKALAVISFGFSVLFTAYGSFLKKERDKLGMSNIMLNEQVDTLTTQQNPINHNNITPSENNSVYPVATPLYPRHEPISDNTLIIPN